MTHGTKAAAINAVKVHHFPENLGMPCSDGSIVHAPQKLADIIKMTPHQKPRNMLIFYPFLRGSLIFSLLCLNLQAFSCWAPVGGFPL